MNTMANPGEKSIYKECSNFSYQIYLLKHISQISYKLVIAPFKLKMDK